MATLIIRKKTKPWFGNGPVAFMFTRTQAPTDAAPGGGAPRTPPPQAGPAVPGILTGEFQALRTAEGGERTLCQARVPADMEFFCTPLEKRGSAARSDEETRALMKKILAMRMKEPRLRTGQELFAWMRVWLEFYEFDGNAIVEWKRGFLKWALQGRLREFVDELSASDDPKRRALLARLFLMINHVPDAGREPLWDEYYGWMRGEYHRPPGRWTRTRDSISAFWRRLEHSFKTGPCSGKTNPAGAPSSGHKTGTTQSEPPDKP